MLLMQKTFFAAKLCFFVLLLCWAELSLHDGSQQWHPAPSETFDHVTLQANIQRYFFVWRFRSSYECVVDGIWITVPQNQLSLDVLFQCRSDRPSPLNKRIFASVWCEILHPSADEDIQQVFTFCKHTVLFLQLVTQQLIRLLCILSAASAFYIMYT